MKTVARIKKVGRKVTLIIPNFAVQAFGLNDGDILELEVKKGSIRIAKKLDDVKYIDSENFMPLEKS